MLTKTLRDQRDSDQQQETEREHFHRRVPIHEGTDLAGRKHHEPYCEHDGGDHDRDLICHSDGGDHRIEREHDIEKGNLRQYPSHCDGATGVPLGAGSAFHALVNLVSAFPDQERTAGHENQVVTGDLTPENCK